MPEEIPTQPTNGVTKYRQDTAEKDIASLEKKFEDLQKQVNEQAITISALKERLSIFAVGEAVLTTIVGAVAAFIGSTK
jgi:hypothetical protein